MSKTNILGSKINSTSLQNAIDVVDKWLINDQFNGRFICVSNVHMIMEGFDNHSFLKIINSADHIVPDGRPLVWAQKLLGHREVQQVRGVDLTSALCQMASEKRIPVGFLGSEKNTLKKLVYNIKNDYINLKIAYSFSPPFRAISDSEDEIIIDDINSSGAKILFIGLGCPKQENWMQNHSKSIKCTMIGVGAAFDYIAGNKKTAPVWMQSMGFEWLFRLISEPKRLWKRYLKHNPRFIWYFLLQLLGKKYD